MRVKRKIVKREMPMVKYVVAVAIGTIITTTVVNCKGTRSYFTSTALAEGNISAARPQDIITCKFETIDPDKMIPQDKIIDLSNSTGEKIINPDKIKIYNKTGKNYIIIYFALSGDAAQYIRQVNPVENFKEITEVEGNAQVKEYEGEVQINVDVNIEQFLSLLKDQESKKSKQDKKNKGNKDDDDNGIDGEISIKYLNNYINKTQKISFTKEYLMTQFLKGIQNDLALKLAQAESKKSLTVNVDKAQSSMVATDNNKTGSVTSDDKENKNDLIAENTDEAPVELTPEEEQVINYISPELLPKMKKLIDDEKSLKDIIAELQDRINSILSQPAPLPQAPSSAAPTVSTPAASSSGAVAPSSPATGSSGAGSATSSGTTSGNPETGSTTSGGTTSGSTTSGGTESGSTTSSGAASGSTGSGSTSGSSESGSSTSSSTTSGNSESSSTSGGTASGSTGSDSASGSTTSGSSGSSSSSGGSASGGSESSSSTGNTGSGSSASSGEGSGVSNPGTSTP